MFNSGFGSREWIEKERIRAEQRMDRVKKIIEADPYAALFGRRLERGFGHGPFGLLGKHQSGQNSLGGLWRELFGVGKGAASTGGDKIDGSAGTAGTVKTASTTGHVKSTKDRSPRMGDEVLSKGLSSNDAPPEKPRSYTGSRAQGHEFDPISGRMAPKSPADSQTENLDFDPITGRMIPKGQSSAGDISYKGTSESEPLGYLSPVKRSDSEVITGTNFNDVQNGQEPEQKDSIASKSTMDEPSDATFKSHSSTLKDTSAKDETPQPRVFHGTPDKAPTKLKIQDSALQSEPILVPENQELDSLRADDIRASYESKMSNASSEVKNEQAQKDEVMPSADSSNVIGEKFLQKFLDQDALTSVDEKITELEKGTAKLKTQLQDVKTMEATTSDVLDGPATTYCVLAYDSSTQLVSRAETASSLSSSDEILHPTQVLPRLNNPAKFVTHFEKMQKDGYEIVSGGGDILIFRKFADVDASRANEAPAEDSTYKTSEADVLSDPQVLEYMASSSPELSSGPTESEAPPREEESGIRKTLRRMVFAGTVTAGTCYAIGVVTEYFRTGGQDGRGIDGFTTFESERRWRD